VSTEKIDPHLTAMIVRSYVRHHRVGTDQISDLITSVHQAFGHLGQPVAPEEVLVPAVSVSRFRGETHSEAISYCIKVGGCRERSGSSDGRTETSFSLEILDGGWRK